MRGSTRAAAAALLVVSTALAGALLPTGAVTATAGEITFDYDGEAVTVAAGESQVISGTTTLPPGTSVTVRAHSDPDVTPGFFQTKTATVDRNGTWAVALDFSEQSPGDTFEVRAIAGESRVSTDGEVVECGLNCEDPKPEPVETVRIDGTNGTVTVADAGSQVVSGSALAPTGTELSVRLRSTDGGTRFFKTRTAVVNDDGTWAAAFDFSETDPGREFAVEATIDGSHVASADGVVVNCDTDCRDQPPTGTATPIPEPTPEETATPSSESDESFEFTESTVQAQQGEVVRFDIVLEGATEVGLTIGEYEESGYSFKATVRDVNGDGSVRVRFDTAAAGREGETATAPGADELTVESKTDLDRPLATGDYTMSAYATDESPDQPHDLASLMLYEGGTATSTATEPATATVTTGAESLSGGGNTVIAVVVSGGLVLGGAGVALLLLRG